MILAANLGVCGSALAAPPPSGDKALDQALHRDLEEYLQTRSSIEHISTLSMTISFRHHPEAIKMAVGTTRRGGGEEVTPANLFQIGSNTKAFTAAIILKLEATKVLSIEDTLGRWLPQYPAWKNVRIRELLNMTSGIPTYDDTPAWQADFSRNPYAKAEPDQLVAYVYPALHKPGSWAYSNTGYMLAQMIIDKASSRHSYQAELQRLLAVNQLHDTFYEANSYPAFVVRRLVSGYYANTDDPGLRTLLGRDTKDFSLGWAQAAGGIISTPADMARWVRDLFEGNVLPPKQERELQRLVAIPGGSFIRETSAEHPQGFGLGVFQVTDKQLGLFWGYQGSTLGYRAVYSYFPASGLIITVFTNSQASAAESQVNTVLFGKVYETLKQGGKSDWDRP